MLKYVINTNGLSDGDGLRCFCLSAQNYKKRLKKTLKIDLEKEIVN